MRLQCLLFLPRLFSAMLKKLYIQQMFTIQDCCIYMYILPCGMLKKIIIRSKKKIAQFQVMVMIKEKEIELIKCNHIFML